MSAYVHCIIIQKEEFQLYKFPLAVIWLTVDRELQHILNHEGQIDLDIFPPIQFDIPNKSLLALKLTYHFKVRNQV